MIDPEPIGPGPMPILDGVPLVELTSPWLRLQAAPAVGGRVVSLVHRPSGCQCLWRNAALPLRRVPPGTAYDAEFYGGIDEQIPCDSAEVADGTEYPDHGELWTQPLEHWRADDELVMRGYLPRLSFIYERGLRLDAREPLVHVRYRLVSAALRPRAFLWKLHMALPAAPGDRVVCPATTAFPLDLAWSGCATATPFAWPWREGVDMGVVPDADGTAEFLCLQGLTAGAIGWVQAGTGLQVAVEFDPKVFPCCQVFASYGKLLGHHTVVLEPSTTPGLSLADAMAAGTCRWLRPGESLETTLRWRVTGPA